MVLLLRNHEIRGLMHLTDYIRAVEDGYREIGRGAGAAFPRENLWIAGEKRDSHRGGHLPAGSKASFKFKAALLPGLSGAGINAYTAGLPQGLETFMFLFDTDTGALIAVMEVLYFDWLKTAAVSALATKYLAPADSTVLALFGAGRHARSQLYAIREVLNIKRVQAHSRNADKRRVFCQNMSAELGIEVIPADSPVVRCATPISSPPSRPRPRRYSGALTCQTNQCISMPSARTTPGYARWMTIPCSAAVSSSTNGSKAWPKTANSGFP